MRTSKKEFNDFLKMSPNVPLKPANMILCSKQVGSLLDAMHPPPYGRQCVTAWWPIRSRRSYCFLHGFTNRIESSVQVTRKGPWLVSYQLAAVRPERYSSARHAELVHTGEDPVMSERSLIGKARSQEWQRIPVRGRPFRLVSGLSSQRQFPDTDQALGLWLSAFSIPFWYLI